MEELKKYFERKLARAEGKIKKIKERHGDNPSSTHTYYGGQTLGYWQGIANSSDLALMKIEKMEQTNVEHTQ